MEYKIYLSGMSMSIDRSSFHKDNLEKDLSFLKDKKETLFSDFDNIINYINKEDDIKNFYNGINLESCEIIVKNIEDQIVFQKDLIDIVSEKVNSKLIKLNSKANVTNIDKIELFSLNEYFVGTINIPFLEENNFSIGSLININDLKYFNKLEYGFKTFVININNKEEDFLLKDYKIIKHNAKGYPLYCIFSQSELLFEPDLFINKYSKDTEHLIEQNRLVLIIPINSNDFLSYEENVKDFIFNNFDSTFKENFENTFGALITKTFILPSGEDSFIDIKNINSLKLKLKKIESFVLRIDLIFEENISLNKAVFVNKFSSVFNKIDFISCYTNVDNFYNCWLFKNGYLISNDQSYNNVFELNI